MVRPRRVSPAPTGGRESVFVMACSPVVAPDPQTQAAARNAGGYIRFRIYTQPEVGDLENPRKSAGSVLKAVAEGVPEHAGDEGRLAQRGAARKGRNPEGGEGIERRATDFAAEVSAQLNKS